MRLTDIYKTLLEKRVINPKTWLEKEPILDTDTITVYHGFGGNSSEYPKIISKYGVSGKVRVARVYSYEIVNNPKGLFVSIDIKECIKNFAGSGVVMEFNTKVSNLEAPVWAGGKGFWGQGQMTQGFDGHGEQFDNEREGQRLKNREKAKEHENPAIANSDRPELAFWILAGAEAQALFVGDLNPNMIQAFWVNDALINDISSRGKWERLSRQEFIKRYPIEEPEHRRGKDVDNYYNAKSKLFRPADDLTPESLRKALEKEYKDIPYDELIDTIDSFGDYELGQWFYPKQIKQYKELSKAGKLKMERVV